MSAFDNNKHECEDEDEDEDEDEKHEHAREIIYPTRPRSRARNRELLLNPKHEI